MPLLRLDLGRLFAGLVGASEARTRDMIGTAEAMAPCIRGSMRSTRAEASMAAVMAALVSACWPPC